jgi:hypothetical protein
MKKFKLVYWSDCRGMEIDGVRVDSYESGRDLLECLIESRIEDDRDGEGWCDYVSDMINDGKGMWLSDKKKWDMFVIGDLDNEVFEINFYNELNSCLVIREDNEYFNRDFDLDLLEEVENKYGI